MPMIDANTAAMHAHLDDEERRERIGQRAEEILNDMVASSMADNGMISDALNDISNDLAPFIANVMNCAPCHHAHQLRQQFLAHFRKWHRDEAIAQAESEAG